jgi:hypothetical protein
MSVLQFPANALPHSLEDFLHEVRNASGRPLRMPIQLRWGGGLGGAIHAVQVVASWAQQNNGDLSLRLPAAFSDQENTRERFASTLPGMAALYFANSIQCDGVIFNRYKALEVVAPRVTAMQTETFRDTLRGQGAALCCFSGARNEFLTSLYAYPEPGRVREISDFRVLLPRMLNQLGVRASVFLKEGQLDYLCGLVYQLFLNADEHGSYDAEGNRYEHAMRGIAVRMTAVHDVPSLVKYAGEDTSLRAFLVKQAYLTKDKSHKNAEKDKGLTTAEDEKLPNPIHLVEISVFDTGPGLALRWMADRGRRGYTDISPEEELEAVQSCFQKHSTTKASQYFGLGLPMALMAMKHLNAFMTLRTGRLSLYQDFSKSDTVEFKPTNRFTKAKKLAEIAGTGYTICFRVK